jgi:hypothetical protein
MNPPSLAAINSALRRLAEGIVTRETVSTTEELLRSAGLDELADVDNFLDMCASFRPGGGDYLYDEQSIERSARALLSIGHDQGGLASSG